MEGRWRWWPGRGYHLRSKSASVAWPCQEGAKGIHSHTHSFCSPASAPHCQTQPEPRGYRAWEIYLGVFPRAEMKLVKVRRGINTGREKLPRFWNLQRTCVKTGQLLSPDNSIEEEARPETGLGITHPTHIFCLQAPHSFFCHRTASCWASSLQRQVQRSIAPEGANTETRVTLAV